MTEQLILPVRKGLLVPPKTDTPEERAMIKMRLRRLYILKVIRDHGPLSRADIARRSGFNTQSVKRMVDEYVSEGFVIEDPKIRKNVGRNPIPCRLNPDAASVLGIHLNQKSCSLLLMDLLGNTLRSLQFKAPAFNNEKDRAAFLKEKIYHLFQEDNSIPPLCGIAIGLPGQVPQEQGDLPGMPIPDPDSPAGMLTQFLSRDIPVPILIANNARMKAVASQWFGAGRKLSSFVYLYFNDDLQVVHINNGQIHKGSFGFSGDVSRISFDGAKSIKEKFLEADFSELPQVLTILINLYNPAGIILDGSFSKKLNQLDDLLLELEGMVPPEVISRTELTLCDLPEDNQAIGAAACVLHHIFGLSHVGVEDVL